MPEFKVTFSRHVVEWHTVYVVRDSEQAVVDDYENGDLPNDDMPDTEITDESDLKIEQLPLDPDVQRENKEDQSRDAVLKLGDRFRVIPIDNTHKDDDDVD